MLDRPHAVVVHNPAAGKALKRSRQFESALAVLRGAGWLLDVATTSGEGDAERLAREAANGNSDVVVAAGGDGTINEVLQGVAGRGVCLASLPLGTVNVWSREVGFSSDPVRAATELTTARRITVDLGRADGRYFLLMAGVGLDAEVAATLGAGKTRKQRFGVLPYVVRAARILPRYTGAAIEMEMDGNSRSHDALMILVSNTRLYGGIARPSPSAVANDGLLDVRVFHGRKPTDALKSLRPFLRGASQDGATDEVRARRVVVKAEPPLAVQVDGDPIGLTPVVIEACPRALDVLIPAHHNSSLFD